VRIYPFLLTALLWIGCALPAAGFNFVSSNRWGFTATNGAVAPIGKPITLRWSIVPDGTVIPDVSFIGDDQTSNLIASFDSAFGIVGGGSDLTTRLWFQRIQQTFDRWSAVSGVTFEYLSPDDGAEHGTFAGDITAPNLRGDIRIGGTNIDGDFGNTLAYTIFPDNGDIVMDTADTEFGNSQATHLRLRNTISHEIGHALGLGHIIANETNVNFLMESGLNLAHDGPQMDDIRGIQHLYGDVYEKNGGNNTSATATNLQTIVAEQIISRGTHAGTGTAVLSSETDFVSIANHNDIDVFSFTIESPLLLDITLAPLGPTYQEQVPGGPTVTTVSSAVSNLSLQVFSLDGMSEVILGTSNTNPIGQPESVLDLALADAGQYFVRITGSSDIVQMYQISLSAETLIVTPPSLTGDYNEDGTVDAADYIVWRKTLGSSTNLAANGDNTGLSHNVIDQADYVVWATNFGQSQEGSGSAQVPEPAGIVYGGLGFVALLHFGRRQSRISPVFNA